uniref:Uncharacterized protein n=1 Tax=Romanomermis culicivorax TaxID=13658 RepID=A0A915KI29_ROMCU
MPEISGHTANYLIIILLLFLWSIPPKYIVPCLDILINALQQRECRGKGTATTGPHRGGQRDLPYYVVGPTESLQLFEPILDGA